VYSNGSYTLLAEAVHSQSAPSPPPTVPTPVAPVPTVPPAPAVTPPSTPIRTTLMPGSVGRTDETTDRLAIFPSGLPWDVDSDRFVALARGIAKRWGIYTGGVTWRTFRFARPDGRNGIGFAMLPYDVLGTTKTWTARVYRSRRVCQRTASGRRCRTVRRYLGRQIIERDTALNPTVPWQQGPAYPGPDEYDLETVIIHELGHWAGNNHRRSCSNPMLAAIDAGDWWRDTTDYRFSGCGVKARIASVAGRLEHQRHTLELRLPAGVPERAAGAFAATAWAHRVATASEE
jgi:hypothetical protein